MTKKAAITKVPATKPTTRIKKTDVVANQEVKKNVDLLSQIKIDLKHKNEIQKKLTLAIKNGDVTIFLSNPEITKEITLLISLLVNKIIITNALNIHLPINFNINRSRNLQKIVNRKKKTKL